MDGVSVVVTVLAVVVIVLALAFYAVALGWAGRHGLAGDARTPAGGATSARPGDSSGSLARGFSYLHVLPHSAGRHPGVQQRMARAFERIDVVDPHAAPRRIGEALVQGGLVEPAPPAQAPWMPTTANRGEELR